MKIKLNYNWDNEIAYEYKSTGTLTTKDGKLGVFKTNHISSDKILGNKFDINMIVYVGNKKRFNYQKSHVNRLLKEIKLNTVFDIKYDEYNLHNKNWDIIQRNIHINSPD